MAGQDWAVIMESVAALEREDAGPGGHAAAAVRDQIPKKPPPPKPPQEVAFSNFFTSSYVSNLDCSAATGASVDRSSGPGRHAAAAAVAKKPPPPFSHRRPRHRMGKCKRKDSQQRLLSRAGVSC